MVYNMLNIITSKGLMNMGRGIITGIICKGFREHAAVTAENPIAILKFLG